MKTAGKLVVLGSINADHILNLESFPTPGETVTGNHYQVAFGGKGANQAVAAGRSGADIAFIACTGDDDIGERIRRQLASDKIDVAPVRAVAGRDARRAAACTADAGAARCARRRPAAAGWAPPGRPGRRARGRRRRRWASGRSSRRGNRLPRPPLSCRPGC